MPSLSLSLLLSLRLLLTSLLLLLPHSRAAPATPAALRTTPALFASQTFDYLLVGGGTAGLVLAARLSEDPAVRVGVLEAGAYVAPGSDPRVDRIALYGAVFGDPEFDWGLRTVPQAGLGGRVVNETSARVLGGSSMICDVLWQRASREEYDAWGTALGNGPHWSFAALEPYFRKAERWHGPPPLAFPGVRNASAALATAHGESGPLQLSYNNWIPEPVLVSVAAANALGIRSNANPNGGNATGFATPLRAVDPQTGLRSSAVSAYFAPSAQRENLVVLTGAHAVRVVFDDGSRGRNSTAGLVARGVEFIAGSRNYTVLARREVILSAGDGNLLRARRTFKTPQILELSGIGNRTVLESIGVETLVDLPGVGENLQDQTYTLSDFVVKRDVLTLGKWPSTYNPRAPRHANWAPYFPQTNSGSTHRSSRNSRRSYALSRDLICAASSTQRTGVFTYDTGATGSTPLQPILPPSVVARLAALVPPANTTAAAASEGLAPLQRAQYALMRGMLAEGRVGWLEFLLLASGGAASPADANTSYVTPIVFHLYPFSRGSVVTRQLLRSARPRRHRPPLPHARIWQAPSLHAPPATRADPFAVHAADVAIHAVATAWTREWMQTPPMAALIERAHVPDEASVKTLDDWAAYVRGNAITTLHPIGTAALAPENLGGVVAPDFKVHRTSNLRVVDASIIPLTFGVAPLATVYAIAEKARLS
ncbi:choline dehydrogenase 2 [Heterobasidion irregulare TC 32-1]|uniref:Choline dehydrogenase 2 n=1 Tax=Heterobasidion irregulare (strain TC 32-1) TaxID=747525 RepID=W4K271_HETIT|nr:choline dehydrogenase 2 [Heterobasidion irregulare TC 32-1]ETW79814.1 choline dehydrogenase 2 [Heterobasidion irregulare TC 32-1]